MKNWIDLVSSREKEEYAKLYAGYLNALSDHVEITGLRRANRGYYGLEFTIASLKMGEACAKLFLSADHPAALVPELSASDEVRKEFAEVEALLGDVDEQKECLSERIEFSVECVGEYKERSIATLSENPWLHVAVKELSEHKDLPMASVRLAAASLLDGSKEYDVHLYFEKIKMQSIFKLSKGYSVHSKKTYMPEEGISQTRRDGLMDCFFVAAGDAARRAKNFQLFFDRCDLSLRAQRTIVDQPWLYNLGVQMYNREVIMKDVWMAQDSTGTERAYMDVSPMSGNDHREEKGNRARINAERYTRMISPDKTKLSNDIEGPNRMVVAVSHALYDLMR